MANEQTKFLDQSNLTLAGGALGLSLTFLHDFAAIPRSTSLLYIGGCCLLASIVLTLASVHTSQHSIDRLISKLDAAATANFAEESVGFIQSKYVNVAAQLTWWLNLLASIALVVGIALVAFFAYNNLETDSRSRAMEKTTPASGVQKGAVPIAPAVARPAQPAQPSQPSQPQGAQKK